MKSFWFKKRMNFGDDLAPFMIKAALGGKVEHVGKDVSPKLVGLGSVLYAAKKGDTVWGTGMHPDQISRRKSAGFKWKSQGVEYLMVRGPLTKAYVESKGGDCPAVFGDPAQALPCVHDPGVPIIHSIGLVPHFSDKKDVEGLNEFVIDVERPWQDVVADIVSCRLIFASSLHGLIVAEAYDIPTVWVAGREGIVKYKDYYAATGRPDKQPELKWMEGSPESVCTYRPDLLDVLRDWNTR